jgi:cysteine synthase
MRALRLFGERSRTLVAATFERGGEAVDVANTLQSEAPDMRVDLVQPHDPSFARKMEPEAQGIWRTFVRSHAVLGPIGLVLGVVTAVTLVVLGVPAFASSPLLAIVAAALFGLFGGLMLAGLLTLRPDRDLVTASIRQAVEAGCWAVVAHPVDPAQLQRTAHELRLAGGRVVRSF